MNKLNKGITLIALVITIIVMLILVGVTINIAVNGGLFGYAGNAARDTELAKQEEQNIVEGRIEVDSRKYDTLNNYIENVESVEYAKIYTKTEYNFTDKNSEKAVIPEGFGIVKECDVIKDGLVISDEFDKEGNSIGNEFVWIPVNYTENGKDIDENGLFDEFEAIFCRSLWDNNARISGIQNSYQENIQNDLTGKYMEMMKSVQKHKGFYVGRFEAGTTSIRTASTSGTTELVVKQDAYPYNYVKWGDNATTIGEIGAVYQCSQMYNDNTSVTSSLCYGVQWDAMLDFIIKNDYEVHDVTNSILWGNYNKNIGETWKISRQEAKYSENDGETWTPISKETSRNKEKNENASILLTTGSNDKFKVKNIYDVAGNVAEWTMEAYYTDRIYRGGNYRFDGGNPASQRVGTSPANTSAYLGFRPALYINDTV